MSQRYRVKEYVIKRRAIIDSMYQNTYSIASVITPSELRYDSSANMLEELIISLRKDIALIPKKQRKVSLSLRIENALLKTTIAACGRAKRLRNK